MTVHTPIGEIVRDGDDVLLVFRRRLQHPQQKVWEAMTDSAQLGRWFGTWSGDPAEGIVQVRMTAEEGDDAQVVTIRPCEAPSHLSVESPAPEGTWPLSIDLSPMADAPTGGDPLCSAVENSYPEDSTGGLGEDGVAEGDGTDRDGAVRDGAVRDGAEGAALAGDPAEATELVFTHALAYPYEVSDIGPGWHFSRPPGGVSARPPRSLGRG